MENKQSSVDPVSYEIGRIHLESNRDMSTRKLSVEKSPYTIPTISSKDLEIQNVNVGQTIMVQQMTSPEASFGQRSVEITSPKYQESDNANHSTVYQNSTIAKHSESASQKPKKMQNKIKKVVSKTNPVHSPIIYIASRPEAGNKTKSTSKHSRVQSGKQGSQFEDENEANEFGSSNIQPGNLFEAKYQRSSESIPSKKSQLKKPKFTISNGQTQMLKSNNFNKPLNVLKMSRNHSEPQFKIRKQTP